MGGRYLNKNIYKAGKVNKKKKIKCVKEGENPHLLETSLWPLVLVCGPNN